MTSSPPSGEQTEPAGRYDRGVKRLDPELVDRIQVALTEDPTLSKSELARRVGCSRATLGYYLRALPEQLKQTADRHEEVKTRRAATHLDLIERVGQAADEVREEIAKLRGLPPSPPTSSATFRGYGVLGNLYRLLGELLGEVSPPTTNLYLTKVDALLSSPIDPSQLSPSLRAALKEEQQRGSG